MRKEDGKTGSQARQPHSGAVAAVAHTAFATVLSAILACAGLALALALTACAAQPQVPVRDSVDDYTWAELSALADQIAASSDDASAIEVAKRHHLVNDKGKLDGSQRKELELADGTKTGVVVAGFRHDDKPDGGKAGITFVFADALDPRTMNNNAGFDERSESDGYDAEGGWLASEMRSWLNGPFVDQLPADLQAALQDVTKRSIAVPEFLVANIDDNVVASFSDESLLSSGMDKLWLPAASEVGNPVEDAEAATERPEWTPVLQAEGERYQLFGDAEEAGLLADVRQRVVAGKGRRAACRWWLRSVEDMTFADVREDGSLDCMQEELAAHPLGVVPCFAL